MTYDDLMEKQNLLLTVILFLFNPRKKNFNFMNLRHWFTTWRCSSQWWEGEKSICILRGVISDWLLTRSRSVCLGDGNSSPFEIWVFYKVILAADSTFPLPVLNKILSLVLDSQVIFVTDPFLIKIHFSSNINITLIFNKIHSKFF